MWVYSCKTILEKLQYQLKPLDASVVLKTYCDREAHEWNNSWTFSLFTAEKSGRASLFIWNLHHVGLGVGVRTCMCTRMCVCVRFPGCDETVPRSQSINNAEQPKHVLKKMATSDFILFSFAEEKCLNVFWLTVRKGLSESKCVRARVCTCMCMCVHLHVYVCVFPFIYVHGLIAFEGCMC